MKMYARNLHLKKLKTTKIEEGGIRRTRRTERGGKRQKVINKD